MARYVWTTSEGKAESRQEAAKAVKVIKHRRDRRKAKAIELYTSGWHVDRIANEMNLSRRTINRYLEGRLTDSRKSAVDKNIKNP